VVEEANAKLLSTSGTAVGLVMVTASLILAGICEVFAFRGFLQNSLTRSIPSRYAALLAILMSAAVFGIFHFDPYWVYMLSTFISGIALGLIYYRWNYVTAATAHATMNLIVLALLLVGF
jgi:membrane protease YdiL (CAAX protease family)